MSICKSTLTKVLLICFILIRALVTEMSRLFKEVLDAIDTHMLALQPAKPTET